jgi:hypothetical protein
LAEALADVVVVSQPVRTHRTPCFTRDFLVVDGSARPAGGHEEAAERSRAPSKISAAR